MWTAWHLHLLLHVFAQLRRLQGVCTPFRYSMVSDCDAALASGTAYPACGDLPNAMVNHRIICEVRSASDLTVLKAVARVLYKDQEQTCVLTDCSVVVICAPVMEDAYVCVEKLATPGSALVETRVPDFWNTVWAVTYTYATAAGVDCPYTGFVNVEDCVNNQYVHGAGKSYGGSCSMVGEFLAATTFMRRSVCVTTGSAGFVRTNAQAFGQYFYKSVVCSDLTSFVVTSGSYAEAFLKLATFPGALT